MNGTESENRQVAIKGLSEVGPLFNSKEVRTFVERYIHPMMLRLDAEIYDPKTNDEVRGEYVRQRYLLAQILDKPNADRLAFHEILKTTPDPVQPFSLKPDHTNP